MDKFGVVRKNIKTWQRVKKEKERTVIMEGEKGSRDDGV